MDKTKLGISVPLMASLVYFLGLISPVALVVAVGYVLIRETDQWLKKAAVQALVIVAAYMVISTVFGFFNNLFGFFNGFLMNFSFIHFRFTYPFHADEIVLAIAGAAEKALLVILGLLALGKKGGSLPGIGRFVDKHMGNASAKPAAPAAYPNVSQPQPVPTAGQWNAPPQAQPANNGQSGQVPRP